VEGALVTLKDMGRKAIETGEDGRFRFASLRPGKYTLVASRPGGQPVENEVDVDDQAGHDHDYDLEVA
jgi:protocatechuate 3,4-dioxygenase beta subunit